MVGSIKTGGKVELINRPENAKIVNENWILESYESIDTVKLIGKMIKIKYNNRIGFCFDTFLINQEYIESEMKNYKVVSPFDYYSKTMKETSKESELIKDGDSSVETGETKYKDGSILTYEYSAYGGGFEVLIEEDRYKELQLMTLKLLELNPRLTYYVKMRENVFTIQIDDCKHISIERLKNSKTVFRSSYGC